MACAQAQGVLPAFAASLQSRQVRPPRHRAAAPPGALTQLLTLGIALAAQSQSHSAKSQAETPARMESAGAGLALHEEDLSQHVSCLDEQRSALNNGYIELAFDCIALKRSWTEILHGTRPAAANLHATVPSL